MENNKKNPIFEPVSAEEAKKIRSYKGGESLTSGSGAICESGISDPWQACISMSSGAECCYYENGQEKRGKCVFTNEPPDPYRPPETFLYTKCKTDQSEG